MRKDSTPTPRARKTLRRKPVAKPAEAPVNDASGRSKVRDAEASQDAAKAAGPGALDPALEAALNRPLRDSAASTGPDSQPDSPTDSGHDSDSEPESDPLTVLQHENGALKDRMLRLMAEMENLRRRTEKSVQDASHFAIAKFARDMLEISDNLARALQAASRPDDGESQDQDGDDFKALLEGVELTQNALQQALQKHGVESINAMGEKFDPNFHQAMFEVPDTSVANKTVVQVVQTGFRLKDRVLRPAMVGIARGGPKGHTPEQPGAEREEADKSAAEEAIDTRDEPAAAAEQKTCDSTDAPGEGNQ